MVLLAEFLKAGIHPLLPREKAEAYAKAILNSAAALRNAYEEARQPLTELKQFGAGAPGPRHERPVSARGTEATLQGGAVQRGRNPHRHPGPAHVEKPGSDPKE
jgi:hypothetical protein